MELCLFGDVSVSLPWVDLLGKMTQIYRHHLTWFDYGCLNVSTHWSLKHVIVCWFFTSPRRLGFQEDLAGGDIVFLQRCTVTCQSFLVNFQAASLLVCFPVSVHDLWWGSELALKNGLRIEGPLPMSRKLWAWPAASLAGESMGWWWMIWSLDFQEDVQWVSWIMWCVDDAMIGSSQN